MKASPSALQPWSLLRALPTLWRHGEPQAFETGPWRLPPPGSGNWRGFAAALGYAEDLAEPPLCWQFLQLSPALFEALLDRRLSASLGGLVHLSQRIERLSPCTQGPSELRLALQPEAQPGGALQLRVNAHWSQQGHDWLHSEGLLLLRAGTQRPPRERREAREARAPRAARLRPGERLAQWQLPADAGRRYARLSGDWNPIHLWPQTSRLLGFEQPIVHGMQSAARCEAELMRHLGRPLHSLALQFRRRLSLPGAAALHDSNAAGRYLLLDQDGRLAAEVDAELDAAEGSGR